MTKTGEIILVLYDIRSTHNVGSIFRTADAAGVSKIYLVGLTPTPLDRFNRDRKDVAKVSLGAEKVVPWKYEKNIGSLLAKLKKEKCNIVALEQDKKSIAYKKYKATSKTALLVGNEVEGIPKEVLKKCDAIIEIPMFGKKESLNVSVATGIALYEIVK
jgi:23S rRNA (guanosine2251-2'-O)-methyltransferase